LVGFGQVGVKIIFTIKLAVLGNGAIKGDAESNSVLYNGAVKHRQYARHSRADGTDVRVRLAAVSCCAGAENFLILSTTRRELQDR